MQYKIISNNKQHLRQWVKEERKKTNTKEFSYSLAEILKGSEEYKQAKHIMIYYPLENEIDLLSLLEDKTKVFYLPKIQGQNLVCCSYKMGEELCLSCFKTKEPLSDPTDETLLDLIIVPALAVDKNNYRLGYGGGFYDRFLQNISCKKIVCISKKFIFDTVYPEIHDIKIDKIISI